MKVEDEIVDVRKHVTPDGPASAGPEEKRDRRHPIHLAPSERHNRSIIIFVTACTFRRRKILATKKAHLAIVKAWQQGSTWLVGRYVVMPDHVHFFCAPNGLEAPSLEKWMRYWKSIATKDLKIESGSLWQRHHWDRQLRRAESYDHKWEYVCSNPIRHNLIADANEWPFQGELNELRW
jgi:putative transposase